MRYECSECGDRIERDRRPPVCRACGTAGTVVRADDVDQDADARGRWLEIGMERPHAVVPP